MTAHNGTPWPDDKVDPDSRLGTALGFTSDKFNGWLWKTGDVITISFLESVQEGQGNLSKLFDAIEKAGYKVAVPTPFARMRAILTRKGFTPSIVREPDGFGVELWMKP